MGHSCSIRIVAFEAYIWRCGGSSDCGTGLIGRIDGTLWLLSRPPAAAPFEEPALGAGPVMGGQVSHNDPSKTVLRGCPAFGIPCKSAACIAACIAVHAVRDFIFED